MSVPSFSDTSLGSQETRTSVLRFLLRPYVLLMAAFWACMVSVSFDIPAVHEIALFARWPLLGMVAFAGLIQLFGAGFGKLPISSMAMGIMIVVAACSALWSDDAEYSIQRAGSLVLLFVATLLGLASYVRRRENAEAIFDVLFFLGAAIAVGGFLFRMGELGPGGRYVGLHNRATGAGSYAALFLPIAIYQVRYRLRGAMKILGWTTIFALLAQIVLSGSRMAAATAGLISLALWFDYYGRRAILALILICVIAPIPILLNGRYAERLEEKSERLLRKESLGTFTGRMDRWAFGLEKWQEKPIAGYGFGVSRTLAGRDEPWRFKLEPGEIFNLHSDQIEVLMDLGIFGYVPFAVFWLALAGTGWSIYQRPVSDNRQRALATSCGVFFAFGDTFMHGGFLAAGGGVSSFSWSMIAITTTLAALPVAVPVRTMTDPEVHPHLAPARNNRNPRRPDREKLPSVKQILIGR